MTQMAKSKEHRGGLRIALGGILSIIAVMLHVRFNDFNTGSRYTATGTSSPRTAERTGRNAHFRY
ncbi:hypothetical protein EJ02DRAFT_219057 [Clathrospora elynae]|uniref:Uncharacterized protein n=1 Tax=Clathrospora elynae TaxID=706981 RepID=A0A6A5SMC1_9PLEO|nr:hypothetical protein EJ02DRAFT_219057 [Clathrospora elynae]